MVIPVFLYGIVLLSMIPVRCEPAEQSEMVTQMLFGETFSVLHRKGDWLYVKNDYDGYEGWVSERTVFQIQSAVYERIKSVVPAVVSSLHATVWEEGQALYYITIGSVLPNYNKEKKTFNIGERTFFFQGEIAERESDVRKGIVSYAKTLLNAPYLWGGKSLYGIDCSGFVQQLARLVSICLPRDASQQIALGDNVNFLSNAKPGDLAFFDNEEGKIVHVGILLDSHKIIHASGRVRIDRIDQEGIFCLELQCYTHRLRILKNILK